MNIGIAYRFLPPTNRSSNRLEGKLMIHNIVPKITDIPFHVLIVYNRLYCSGSLISSKVVVTAATCLHKYSGDAHVKVGSDTITGFGQIIPVQDVKIHEYYKHKSELDNDIALLVLKNNVVFGGNVEKVRLIESDTALYEDSVMYVSGWGGNDQRLSDNGGGAIFNNLLVGVLSYGATKTEEPSTAIFTNISYFHKWMKINTLRLLKKHCATNNYIIQPLDTHEYD